jgi:hypothetical protein
MITTGEIREFEHGLYILMLDVCSSLVLPHILNENVPYIWLEGHSPHPSLEWWRAEAPIRKGGKLHSLKVRTLRYDIQMATKEFLALLPEFKDAGMLLMQMEREVPNTLCLSSLNEKAKYNVLVQNGLYLEFYLPHAREYASVVSARREVLEGIRDNPVIASGGLP